MYILSSFPSFIEFLLFLFLFPYQVGTIEMAQTMAVNAIAPFVLCSQLKAIMMPPQPIQNQLNKQQLEKQKQRNNAKNNINDINTSNNCSNTEQGKSDETLSLDNCYSHIVNVTALEGKFNVGKKSGGHPHTVLRIKFIAFINMHNMLMTLFIQ